MFGENIAGKPFTYKNLKLRIYLRKCSKAVTLVHFADEFIIKYTLYTKVPETLFSMLDFYTP